MSAEARLWCPSPRIFCANFPSQGESRHGRRSSEDDVASQPPQESQSQWSLEALPRGARSQRKVERQVRIGGHVEPHAEGTYYIEWRENGQRRREAVSERSDVRARARLKAFELEARRAGIEIGAPQNGTAAKPVIAPAQQPIAQPAAATQANAASGIFETFGTFLGQALEEAVKAQLSRLGFDLAGKPVFPERNNAGPASIAEEQSQPPSTASVFYAGLLIKC